MQTLLCPHWAPCHAGGEDDRFMLQLRPKLIKLFFAGDSIPRLDVALSAATDLVVLRNHGISENWDQRGISNMAHAESMARDHTEAWRKLLAAIPNRNKLAVEGLNEPEIWDWGKERPELVSHYYAEFARLMAIQGVRAVVANFGVGWPGNGEPAMPPDSPPIWKPFAEMIETIMKLSGFLGLHEYWYINGPREPWIEGTNKYGGWGWWAGRFKTCPWNVPMIITECGIDAHVLQGKDYYGWHGLSEPRESVYMQQFVDYEKQCILDGRVFGFTPFTEDFYDSRWATYSTRTEQFHNLWIEHARKMEKAEYSLPAMWALPHWSSEPWKPDAPYVPPVVVPPVTPPVVTPPATTEVVVYDINGTKQTLAWLKDTYGLWIDKTLRRASAKNWQIAELRAVRAKAYFVEVIETAGETIQVGRTWLDSNGKAQAPNGWGDHAAPDNVTCPPEAKGSVVIATAKGPGTLQVNYMAGPGDVMTGKNGTNMFWMIDHRYGSDVLRCAGVIPGDVTFKPQFKLVDPTVVVPEPEPEPEPEPPTPVVGKWDKVVAKWDKIVVKYAKECGLSREMVHAIIILESGGDPNAINASSGAGGLMQIMPREAGFADRPTQAELLVPDLNVKWGCQILKDKLARFSTTEAALCAYGGVSDPTNLQGDKAQKYLYLFKKAWTEAWPGLALPIVIPQPYQIDKKRLTEVRWYAEESLRKIEAQDYAEARKLMLEHVIDPLYGMCGDKNPK